MDTESIYSVIQAMDDTDACLLLTLAGVSWCFAALFIVAALRRANEAGPCSREEAQDGLKRPSVAPSEPFRATIATWCGTSQGEQIVAMDRFREALTKKGKRIPDDLTCLRFLRARRLHLDRALLMYDCYADWYICIVVGRVMKAPMDDALRVVLDSNYPSRFIGRDLKGRPVKHTCCGQLDMAFSRKQGIQDHQLVDYHICQMELMERALALRDASTCDDLEARPGPDVDASLHARDPLLGHVSIFDVHGCSVSKFWPALRFWTSIAKIDQDSYPEILGQLIFVRPPRLFGAALNVVKRVLDKRTCAKIEVVEGDPFERIAEIVGYEKVPLMYWKDQGHPSLLQCGQDVNSDPLAFRKGQTEFGAGVNSCGAGLLTVLRKAVCSAKTKTI